VILDNLLSGVQHVDALQRLNAAIVLGTVDEVDAIPMLVEAFKNEREADVKQALAWAGKRLQAARQSGYSTLERFSNSSVLIGRWLPMKTSANGAYSIR
jgi:hypothetical protein